MEIEKPKSIQTIGLIVSIFAGFVVFSNSMGALSWSILGFGDDLNNQSTESEDLISFLFTHYIELCFIMLLFGIGYLVGGIFIRKYKMWANKLVRILSILLILIIWGLMIIMAISVGKHEGMILFSVGAILIALFWSIPIVLLIRFLNKKEIKLHFD